MKTNGRMVHYEKAMRERAAREKKFLVTISIEGKHLKDDSCTVQALADLPKAKELTKIALELFKREKTK
jgi:hypothetical protein